MTPYLLQHLLDRSTAIHPDKLAVKMGTAAITYKSLSEKSDQLATMLIASGFKPKSTAGVLLNKSIEAIIAFFGILKAGGAYIPLDLHYSPAERIKSIFLSSRSEFLVSDSKNMAELSAGVSFKEACEGLNIVRLDEIDHFKKIDQHPSTSNRRAVENCNGIAFCHAETRSTDDDLAYILYTSGSTGSPKGVMLTHLNALTFINWALSCFNPSSEDIFSSHAPFHFDLSVFDIYVSIASGACLNIAPPNICANPRALIEWIAVNKITCWYSVPSVWISILNYAAVDPEALKNLRYILFAGEVFSPKHLKQLMAILPRASYYNLYGPTETNVCTYWHVQSSEDVTDRPVPIGRACADTEVVVLNEDGAPVAAGQTGELMVKGPGVTKGYYNDPEKTEGAFLKSPISCHNGALLYKTGDIVKVLQDGVYEFIGRKDFMVKCAGYRIEIPEIEYSLCGFEPVEEAVVVPVFNKGRGTTELHGFVKMKKNADFSVIKTKSYLGGVLPKYMIPEIIERVEIIPKNANGKIDRQAMMNRAVKSAVTLGQG